VDITTGNTAGRDALRTYLGGGTAGDDAELQAAWDTTVDALQRFLRPGYTTDAPAGVLEYTLAVAATVYRIRDSAGEVTVLPDGTLSAPGSIQSAIYKYRALGGPYVVTPRVIA